MAWIERAVEDVEERDCHYSPGGTVFSLLLFHRFNIFLLAEFHTRL